MTNEADDHQRSILEQFTKQAVPLSQTQNPSPDPHFPDEPRLSARHLRQNPGIPSVFDHSLPK